MEDGRKEEQMVQNGKSGKKKVYIIAAIIVVLALIASAVVYAAGKWNKVKKTELPKEELSIAEEVEEELDEEYLNVALFGINMKAADDEKMDSDAVYVLSINLKTKKVQIVSVYGNTQLCTDSGKVIRMKDAYAEGGPQQAIALLNANLDLDIEKYVSVNFKAMADIIDILGGVDIKVTEKELPHVNGYARDIAAMLGEKVTPLKSAGKHTLNGIQAVGYCRIRITKGGDVKRAKRQKRVIKQMKDKLEAANFSQIDEIMDKVFPEVETNFTLSEAANYGKDMASYQFADIQTFPMSIRPQSRKGGKDGDYAEIVECADYENDVIQLHGLLFEGIDYEPSDRVKESAKVLGSD